MDDTNLLVQCDFEVFGHVQGKKWLLKEIFFGTNLNFREKQALDSQSIAVITAWIRAFAVGSRTAKKEL